MSTKSCSAKFLRKSNILMDPLKFKRKSKICKSVHFDPSCDATKTRGSVDYPSTRGIQVDVGLPDTTSKNRAESPLYGELYPNIILVYNLHLPVPNNPIYAIYIKYGHLGP